MPSDEIDYIPLKNLPYSGLTLWTMDDWKEGEPTQPNNVLISCINKMKTVSLVGRERGGLLRFTSSVETPQEIIRDLKMFIHTVESQM